jgi:predicted kinase
MAQIVGTGYDEAKRAEVEGVQWEVAQRVLGLGVSVVLESGFLSRAHRRDFAREPESWVQIRS